MNYEGFRREHISFYRVALPRLGVDVPWVEVSEYQNVFTGGNIEFSNESDLGVSGSLDFSGLEIPSTSDLVRIKYTMTDENGQTHRAVLGTFLVEVTEPTYDMDTVNGECDLLSVLHIAASRKFKKTTVLGRGGYCVDHAKALIESCGLRVSASDSYRMLNSNMVFEADTSYLEAANALLAAAGFDKCRPDAYGNVLMQPKATGALQPAWTFRDGDKSIMKSEVPIAESATTAPNSYGVAYDGGTYSAWAIATNNDEESPLSIPRKGYEISACEEVSDLEAENATDAVAELKELANRRLVEQSGNVESVTMTHPWLPLDVSDAVRLEYKAAGIFWDGQIAAMKMSFDTTSHIEIETKATRQCPADFVVTLKGGVL